MVMVNVLFKKENKGGYRTLVLKEPINSGNKYAGLGLELSHSLYTVPPGGPETFILARNIRTKMLRFKTGPIS
jgi:hypothetical protein